MTRFNINLDEKLLKSVDEKAKSLSITRTAYISIALSEKLRNDVAFEKIPEMLVAIQELNRKTDLMSDETE
jgi:ribbon-helix-helix protein, copG family